MSFRLVPRSLKYRLLLAFLLGMIVIEVAASYLAYRLMERHTWNEFDRVLEEKVQFYRSTLFYNHVQGALPDGGGGLGAHLQGSGS